MTHSGFSLGPLQYSAPVICFVWLKGGCTNTEDTLACLYKAVVSGSVMLMDHSSVKERGVVSQHPSDTWRLWQPLGALPTCSFVLHCPQQIVSAAPWCLLMGKSPLAGCPGGADSVTVCWSV